MRIGKRDRTGNEMRTGKRDREGRFAVDNQTDGMKNDNDKNIKTRYEILKQGMIFLKSVFVGFFPDIPERMPEAACSSESLFPCLRLILCFQIERGVGYMRNKILALLLCISLGAGAVPSLAAESEKTVSPAVTVEDGKSSGTEQSASSTAAAVEGAESSVAETEAEQAASFVAASLDAGELPDSKAANNEAADSEATESEATESDLSRLLRRVMMENWFM